MLSQVFTIEDTALYPTWHYEEGGIVSLCIPGIGEVRMSLDKAQSISEDIARQVEYGRWAEIEKNQVEKKQEEPHGELQIIKIA